MGMCERNKNRNKQDRNKREVNANEMQEQHKNLSKTFPIPFFIPFIQSHHFNDCFESEVMNEWFI